VALVYIGLGDLERAIEWLEKGYEERDHSLGHRPCFRMAAAESFFLNGERAAELVGQVTKKRWPARQSSIAATKRRLKAGGRQNCLPHVKIRKRRACRSGCRGRWMRR
jgi:hypothetical protein